MARTSTASFTAAVIGANLYPFIRASFPIVSGGNQFLPNWHVEAMAHHLSEVMKGRMRRLIITVPPRSLKHLRQRRFARFRSGP